MQSITVQALSTALAQPHQLVLIDVRREGVYKASGLTLPNAMWRDPALWLDWKDEVAALQGSLVFVCAHGHEIGQAMTAALSAMGKDASYLEGGFAQWQTLGNSVVAA